MILIAIMVTLFVLPSITCYAFPPKNASLELLESSEYEDILGRSAYKRFKRRHKILVVGGNEADDIDLFTVLSVFSKAGLDTRFAGGMEEHGNISFTTLWNLTVTPKVKIHEISRELPYEMIIIPGGKAYSCCMTNKKMRKIFIDQDRNMRYVAAMSTASFGYMCTEVGFGKQITVPQTFKNAFIHDYYVNNIGIVHDGHVLTTQGPFLAMEFSLYVVELFLGRKIANELASELGYERNLQNIKIVKPFKN